MLAGGFFLLAAVGWLVAMADMIPYDEGMIIALGVVYLAVGGLYLAAAAGLWKLKAWGRTLQIVFSILGLCGVPIGTIISALILFYLFRPGVKLLFSGREPGGFDDQELADIARVSSPAMAWAAVIVVVLAVIGVLGMIAAIAIPNSINAVNRGRQKRTVSDMRSLATAAQAYQVDFGHFPLAISSLDELERFVSPDYIRAFPAEDGWQQPFIVSSNQDGTSFVVVSYGRDGIEGPQPGGATSDYDCDIVWEDGSFTQWPEGIQN
jgi:general secretion pathway protein G